MLPFNHQQRVACHTTLRLVQAEAHRPDAVLTLLHSDGTLSGARLSVHMSAALATLPGPDRHVFRKAILAFSIVTGMEVT